MSGAASKMDNALGHVEHLTGGQRKVIALHFLVAQTLIVIAGATGLPLQDNFLPLRPLRGRGQEL